MLIRLKAHRYRSLRWVDVPVGPFNALIGPNASGKSNFLDVLLFVKDMITSRKWGYGCGAKESTRLFPSRMDDEERR
ncbi:MAG: AAA family ATPase [Thermotogae bacterium]|nr:AAA family ATPase [Thermotogota bacterium]